MANQLEELQLSVNLNDQATPGLQRLRRELQMLGAEVKNIDKFGQSTKTLGSQFKNFALDVNVAHYALKALHTAVGGVAAVLSIRELKQWSDQIQQTANAMRVIGSTYESFRNISSQLREVGISGAQTARIMSGLNQTIAQLSRPGSSIRETLMMQSAPGAQAQMATFLNSLTKIKSDVQLINQIRI